MTWSGVTTPRWPIVGEVRRHDEVEDLRAGAEIEHEALGLRIGAQPAFTAQAPRMIGAISAAEATSFGSVAAANTLRRPLARRCSARVTCAIMRS